jgi:hypothetical protein
MDSDFIKDYFENLPEDRKIPMNRLRETILNNIPKEIVEVKSYGTPGYVIPHEVYPAGYHCDPKLPLPFLGLSSMKNHISLHAFCIYGNEELSEWFLNEFPKYSKSKLDMGKGCIRFKKMNDIPYDLIAELLKKIDLNKYIEFYETNVKRK